MKNFIYTISALLILATHSLYAGDFVALVNNDAGTTALTKSEVTAIYKGKKEQWPNGVKIKPSYLKKGAPGSDDFFGSILDLKVKKFKKIWLKKVFAGYGTEPSSLGSADAIASFVKTNPGAIGVIPADKAAGVAGVAVIPLK